MPIGTVFSEVATKIGLLDMEAAQAATHFYGMLAALRKKVDVPMPALEPTAGADGLYNISGGEQVASALYRAERMLPNVIDLGMLAIAKLDGGAEKRNSKQERARRKNRSREHGF